MLRGGCLVVDLCPRVTQPVGNWRPTQLRGRRPQGARASIAVESKKTGAGRWGPLAGGQARAGWPLTSNLNEHNRLARRKVSHLFSLGLRVAGGVAMGKAGGSPACFRRLVSCALHLWCGFWACGPCSVHNDSVVFETRKSLLWSLSEVRADVNGWFPTIEQD